MQVLEQFEKELKNFFEFEDLSEKQKNACKLIIKELITWSRTENEISKILIREGYNSEDDNRIINKLMLKLKTSNLLIKKKREVYPKTIKILHLSDIQIGKDTNDIFLNKFRFELKSVSEKEKIDLIVITGDLTSTGSKLEYNDIKLFLTQINILLPQITRDRIIFVPGNHDINWNLSKIDKSRKFENYLNFINSFYSVKGEKLNFVKYFDLNNLKFPVIGLNSCVEITHDEISHRKITLDEEQINNFYEFLVDHNEEYPLKIYCLHHPPNILKGWNGSIVTKLSDFTGIHLFLYGDIHTENLPSILYAKDKSIILSIGVGSPTVKAKSRIFYGSVSFTQFNVITITMIENQEDRNEFSLKIDNKFLESKGKSIKNINPYIIRCIFTDSNITFTIE